MQDGGEQFGSFRLIRRIAKGGMAEIFLAVEQGIEGIERRVVVKRILPEMTQSDDFVTMFTDEARLTTQLAHPNIAHIYSVGEVGGQYYIAMEYVDGLTVSGLMRKARGALPLPVALRVASDVCAGLHYAHELEDARGRNLGVIHRDVSPQNVMVSKTGEAKLIDFGVARASTQVHVTGVKQVKGKLAYMAPELLRGQMIDRRTDIFAAGVVFYEMLTGTRLFRRVSEAATVMAVTYEDPASVESFGLDRSIDAVVGRALQKDAERRFQTAGEMQHALEQLIADLSVTASTYIVGQFMRQQLADRPPAAAEPRRSSSRFDGEGDGAWTGDGDGDDGSDVDIDVAMPVETSAPRRGDPSESVSAASLPSVSMTPTPASDMAPRRSRGLLFTVGALVVLALLAGTLVLGIRLGSGGREEPEHAPLVAASGPTSPTPGTPTPLPPVTRDGGRPGTSGASSDAGPAAPAPAEDAAAASGADGDLPSDDAPPGKGPSKAAPRGFGTLYLDTEPWSRVRASGRSLGTTPVVGAKLPAGMHVIRLVDADGQRHVRRVRIRPDQPTKAFFRLSR